jgi:histidinol-phosphate aminotransferase
MDPMRCWHTHFLPFFQHDAPLLMPDISYSFYQVYCHLYGIAVQTVPLTRPQWASTCRPMRVPARLGRPRLVSSSPIPNAPTGIGLGLRQIEQLLQLHPQRVVLVDEAYVDFGGDSAIPLIDQYPNLLVVHTLSKSRSLAGLRVGFACGQAPLIDALARVKNSFNSYPLDRLAIAGAVAAFEDQAYFEQTRQAVMSAREGLALALEDLGL